MASLCSSNRTIKVAQMQVNLLAGLLATRVVSSCLPVHQPQLRCTPQQSWAKAQTCAHQLVHPQLVKGNVPPNHPIPCTVLWLGTTHSKWSRHCSLVRSWEIFLNLNRSPWWEVFCAQHSVIFLEVLFQILFHCSFCSTLLTYIPPYRYVPTNCFLILFNIAVGVIVRTFLSIIYV